MVHTFRMPPAPESAFDVFPEDLPRILHWLASKVRQWAENTRYEVRARDLRIRGTLYGRRIRRQDLQTEGARRVSVDKAHPLYPKFRTNGIGLPGYAAGWFRLNSGEKALVFVTDPDRVVYVPTRRRFALLLSVDEPDEFLAALRDSSPSPHARSA
ncbi:MAG TPA: PH domain-containing protein [Longimicrobiales bacterium]